MEYLNRGRLMWTWNEYTPFSRNKRIRMSIPLRLLVIEDSEDDVLLLTRELKRGGYDPVFARVETAAGMRKALARGDWDIIVSDYIMPRFSGLDAIAVLKESGLDIPFIIVSGKIGEDIAVGAMRAGAHDYIVKGNLARLVPAVERELREVETRRKRAKAEDDLRESEDKFIAIAATATDAILIVNAEGNISYWNPSAEKIFGYKEQEALGRPLHRFLALRGHDASTRQGFGEFLKTDIGPAIDNIVEFSAFRKDGTRFPVEVSLAALEIKHRQHAVGFIRDISERRRAEEELKRHRDNLEELVEERAAELKRTNAQLQQEIAVRMRIEEELRDHRDHLDLIVRERTSELRKANRDLRAEVMRRIQMEKDLIESQRFVQRIADATPTLLYLYDIIEDKNIYINERVHDILGYTPEQVKKMGGAFFRTILHPDDSRVIESIWRRMDDAEEGDIVESEFRLKNCHGEWRWFHSRDVIFKRSGDERLKLVLGIAQDITERKEAEEELRASREQLRILLAHLQFVREEERTRIAREIHDELGQSLTALKMDLAWLVKRLDKGQKQLYEKAQVMSKHIDMNIQTVKRISTELRPGLLDDLGIAAALEWQAEEFKERTGIQCDIRVKPEDISLDRNRSTTIFRIFQETLTNVVRHAHATKVEIDLKENGGELTLQVKDNGKGITDRQISSPKSIGLIGMRERVMFFGGGLSITGEKNKGTTVTVSLPLSDN
jgi:PAS domain S-box-containing protein